MNPHATSIITTTSDQPARLYAAAHLITLAEGFGAKHPRSVHSTIGGSTEISVRMPHAECYAEIGAWQSATDQAWDVETVRYHSAGVGYVTRFTYVELPTPFGPQKLRISFSSPASAPALVGAL